MMRDKMKKVFKKWMTGPFKWKWKKGFVSEQIFKTCLLGLR